VLTTVTDTGSTLTNDVVGTIRAVEAAPPVLRDVTDNRGHADQRRGRHDRAGRGGAAVLATVTDTVGR